MTVRPAAIAIVLFTSLLVAATSHAGDRRLAIIVDTSSSMRDNDGQRYTMQLSQVISDLADTDDELFVIRMPGESGSSCSAGPSTSLVLRLDPARRATFKRDLDQLIDFDTGTYFAAPIRTAASLLARQADKERMLLIIADSGGLGWCGRTLTKELLDLKSEGVTIAAINLGSSSGAFDRNPAFDFTTPALDAQGLIEAVARVYQRFLGSKKVQTGRVQGNITVDVAPFVDEAFLVVAADGPIGALEQAGGNPGAAAIDLNHRGGGRTTGLDGVVRAYRIARLQRPAAGRWTFRASGISGGAGWMLIQDPAIGARLVSSPVVPKNVSTPVEIELYDTRTGQRVAHPSTIPGLQATLDVDGRQVTFRDDGQGGDRQANDGVLTATTTFGKTGDQPMTVHLQTDFLDRSVPMNAKVTDAAWKVNVTAPKSVEVDQPTTLSVDLQPIGSAGDLRPPERIDVSTGGPVVPLLDDGKAPDREAADRTYSGTWTPREPGTFRLEYAPRGGSVGANAIAPVQVVGRLKFGPSVPIRFGTLKSESETVRELDLRSADVRGAFDVQVTTTFERERTRLELESGGAWMPLGSTPQTLQLTDGGPRVWRIRMRVGECPEAHLAKDPFELVLTSRTPAGQPVRATVPVSATIVADPWLHCWWPVVAAVAGLLLISVIIHGFWSPSRFPPRLGVVLSPEEDINEGFFHPIRAQRGSGSGFYRDASICIAHDFRLTNKSANAIARLRADHKVVRIAPVGGSSVWRRNADDVWEQLPPGESTARFGHLYRNESGTLFFELRNA